MARNPDGGGGILGPVLLAIVGGLGICLLGTGVGIGAGMVMDGPLDRASSSLTQPQEEEAPQPVQTGPTGTFLGPTMRVENGTVVWRKGDDTSTVDLSGGQGEANNTEPVSNPEAPPESPVQPPDPETPQTPDPPAGGDSGSKTPTNSVKPSGGGSQTGVNINPSSPSNSKPSAEGDNQGNSGNGNRNTINSNGSWGNDSTTNEITGELSKKTYWVTGGKSYHFLKSCPSLSRSTDIKEGTLQEALNSGKTDPCNNCAGGS